MITDKEIQKIFDWADENDIKGHEKQPRNSKWGIDVPIDKQVIRRGIPRNKKELLEITHLNLSKSKLDNLSAELFNLTNLISIDLSDNYLSDLPMEIATLKKLYKLNLHNCSFEELPKEVVYLTNLTHLYLSSCKKLKKLPREIENLKNLIILDLGYCENLEYLPKEIGKLSNLIELNLASSGLSELPKEIGNLINLEKLNLYGNELSELPKEIGKLTNLIDLDLHYSKKLEQLPKEIGQLINLKYLDLDDCESLEPLPKEIGNLVNLEKIIVSGKALFTNYDFSKRTTPFIKKELFSDDKFGNLEFDIKNLLLKGVPGTGKSRAIEKIINKKLELEDHKQNILRINIHSASSNADLMQGIGISSNNGQIEYKEKQGLILNFIEKATFNPNQPFVLVLEEIQENSLNELIGDLIYLIEDDKRAKEYEADEEMYGYQELVEMIITDEPETAYVEVPYLVNSSTKYRKMIMPNNLYIFCTSNYRDDKKVIEDNLLRRFEVLEIYPKADVVHKYCQDFFRKLNENILIVMNDEIHPDRFLIGHSNWIKVESEGEFYRAFLKVVVEFKDIKEVEFSDFKEITQKLPLTQELNFDSYKKLIEDLQTKAGYDFLD